MPGVPHVESPLFEQIFREKKISPETLGLARQLRRDGFAVIDFPDSDFNCLADAVIKSLDQRYNWEGWKNGTDRNLRLQDAWQTVPEVKQIACNPTILRLLSDLYGKRAFPFQTLNFPVGTQQHFHTDCVHFSSCPERFMAGVWVALEDIDSDNGPLVYYPGSHALPVFANEHLGRNPDWGAANPYAHYAAYEKAWEAIVDSLELKPLQFHAKKGQALIWAANLLHGGSAQNDLNRTRYSQVTHYYFEGCSYFTPIGTVPFLGKFAHREIVDITTGKLIPNTINGQEVPNGQTTGTSVKLSPPAEKVSPLAKLLSPLQGGRKITKPVRLPADFDGAAYLNANPDVKAAKVDPAQHWLEFGCNEGRPLR